MLVLILAFRVGGCGISERFNYLTNHVFDPLQPCGALCGRSTMRTNCAMDAISCTNIALKNGQNRFQATILISCSTIATDASVATEEYIALLTAWNSAGGIMRLGLRVVTRNAVWVTNANPLHQRQMPSNGGSIVSKNIPESE